MLVVPEHLNSDRDRAEINRRQLSYGRVDALRLMPNSTFLKATQHFFVSISLVEVLEFLFKLGVSGDKGPLQNIQIHGLVLGGVTNIGQPKVDQPDSAFADEHIRGCKIAMNDAVAVQLLHYTTHLTNHFTLLLGIGGVTAQPILHFESVHVLHNKTAAGIVDSVDVRHKHAVV